jgi:hypothetical protein
MAHISITPMVLLESYYYLRTRDDSCLYDTAENGMLRQHVYFMPMNSSFGTLGHRVDPNLPYCKNNAVTLLWSNLLQKYPAWVQHTPFATSRPIPYSSTTVALAGGPAKAANK